MSRLKYAIFCEDIRQEVNGKLIVLGIYNSEIIVNSFPFNGRLALLLGIQSPDGKPVEVELGGEGGASFGKFMLQAELVGGDSEEIPDEITNVPLPPISVNLSGPETIFASVKFGDGPVEIAARVAVVKLDLNRPSHKAAIEGAY